MHIISANDPTWEHDCEEAAKTGQPFRVSESRSSHLPFLIRLCDQYTLVPQWKEGILEFRPMSKGSAD